MYLACCLLVLILIIHCSRLMHLFCVKSLCAILFISWPPKWKFHRDLKNNVNDIWNHIQCIKDVIFSCFDKLLFSSHECVFFDGLSTGKRWVYACSSTLLTMVCIIIIRNTYLNRPALYTINCKTWRRNDNIFLGLQNCGN